MRYETDKGENMDSKYIPYEERNGDESIVYFTRDLSEKGLEKAYKKICSTLKGKVAVKLHTGEAHGPNILPRPWVKKLFQEELKDATIVETNTYYDGDRYTTEDHRKTLLINEWDFAPVDILDEDGITTLPVIGGKYFKEMSIGSHELNYDSLLVLTHFKGHTCGGFGGSNKNIGIGCADGRIGKKMIHTPEDNPSDQWGILKEEFMERMTESTKATIDHFKGHVAYINVLRNMSVDCDCTGVEAAPVVTPNVGILASLDICAIDTASIDIVYAMKEEEHRDLVERIESRHGLRQLTYMHELGMGNMKYVLIDLDNDEKRIHPSDCVKNLKPFEK